MRSTFASLFRRIILVILFSSLIQTTYADAPYVVVSIKPVHSLVSSIMQGIGKPELLIPANQSPHAFSLRPSDVKKLRSAKLFVWIGGNFETPITHLLESFSNKSTIIELMNQPNILYLPARKGGVWENKAHQTIDDEHDTHHHNKDPHIWLSIKNARAIVNIIQAALTEIDSENRSLYQINADRLLADLDVLERDLNDELLAVRDIPFMVFHDAYQYFEHQFSLNTVGSITINPERQPGLKRVHEVHDKLKRMEARCIFSEPQFEPKLLKTIVEDTQVKAGILDPIGADLPAGTETYSLLLHNLKDNLLDCLGEKP